VLLCYSVQSSVLFPDPNLDHAVAAALGKPPGRVSPSDLGKLTCLTANNLQITNLAGLESAVNLTGLYLNRNAVQDLTPIRGLMQIASLEFEENQVSDLSALLTLTNLRCLSFGGNPITNYWTVSNLTQLASLSVRTGTFKDLGVLKGQFGLQSLVLWGNEISDPSPLAGLTNLDRLDLRWNAISNSVPAKAWPTNLTSLYLGGNALSNAASLQGLRNLALLNLEDNWIRDLSPLKGLTNLTYFALSRDPATNYYVLTNLTSLVNLELRGNSLTNIDFLSRLPKLAYVDLAYNRLSGFSALTNVPTLTSVVGAGNPVSTFADFARVPALTNLWLFDLRIADTNLPGLLGQTRYLNLEQTGLTNVTPWLALTNLTGLALSRNAIADYSGLSTLTNLTSLRLEGCSLTNINFLAGLTNLSFLSLAHNRIADVGALSGLPNLRDLYLKRNRLTDLQPLLALGHLATVDVSLNFLDLRAGMTTLSALQILATLATGAFPCSCGLGTNSALGVPCQRPSVIFLPTNQPPELSSLLRWFVPCGSTSSLPILVSEYPAPEDPIPITAVSSNPSLVSVLVNPLAGTNQDRTLGIAAGCDPVANTSSVRITATDDVGLSASLTVQTFVIPNLSLASLCPNADSNLVAGLSSAAAKAPGDLTAVDLLRLADLNAMNAATGDPCLWPWLTNLTSLELSGASVTNFDFLTNLTQVASLALSGTQVPNGSALLGLSNLTFLSLTSSAVTNIAALNTTSNRLITLDLTGDSLVEVSFLTNFNQLLNLRLDDNPLADLSPLARLTNLQSLTLQQDFLTTLAPLASLKNLSTLDARLNLLDLSDSSASWLVISNLQYQNFSVQYSPQRVAPVITVPTQWFVAANATSSVVIPITDNAVYPAQLSLGVHSSNTSLVADQALSLTPATGTSWLLQVTPTSGQVGNTLITLTATNNAGLGSTASFPLSVAVSQPVSIQDPNLQAAILAVLGRTNGSLTTVDLLDLSWLSLVGAGISSVMGLNSATNLTTLILDNDLVSDVTPLTNLFALSYLSVSNNLITDISPLSRLTNLTTLNLARNPITNFPVLLSGFPLLSNLDLTGDRLTSVFFLTNLSRLTGLTLDHNAIANAALLGQLGQLTSLSVSDNLLTNVDFLTNLAQLAFLDLSTNQIGDISSFGTLPLLQTVYLQQNILTNISALQKLSGSPSVSVQQNELDLSITSPVLDVINSLQIAGATVVFMPQFPLDSDGDGMPDDWEIAHGLNPYDPGDAPLDSDHDGNSNLLEYALGTDPRNPADASSGLHLGLVSDGLYHHVMLQFLQRSTPARIQYVPEVSGDAITWYSDAAHIQQLGPTPFNDQFNWVTTVDLTPVKVGQARVFRLRVVRR